MHYLLLVYENTERWSQLPDTGKRQVSDACYQWHDGLTRLGQARAAVGLHPPETATIVRNRGGRIEVVDGPFAETKEVLGGFEHIECKDLDAALAAAKTFPALKAGFAMEVRPVLV
ncbi:MAG: hypothetical protein JNG83_09140 [Opitutaceae bacterium]|nr:hypothetical protein [Opitutaceae bacterium]